MANSINRINVIDQHQPTQQERLLGKTKTNSNKNRKPYLPSHKRATQPPPWGKSKYDDRILLTVNRFGILSAPQIAVLCILELAAQPRYQKSAAQRRLQRLYHHQLVNRLKVPKVAGRSGRIPYAYALDQAGIERCVSELGVEPDAITRRPKYSRRLDNKLFLHHTLMVRDVEVLIHLLDVRSKIRLLDWKSELSLKRSQKKAKNEHLVPYYQEKSGRLVHSYPDSFFVLQLPGLEQPQAFWLECDRATLPLRRWRKRIKAYENFLLRGDFQRHYDYPGFIVLTTTSTQERVVNLKRATEAVLRSTGEDGKEEGNNKSFYLFTTHRDHVDIWQPEGLLQPIWSVATSEALFSLGG